MPNLAGVFHREGPCVSLEPALARQAEVLSVQGLSFHRCQWTDGRFGAVNLLKPEIDDLDQPARLEGGPLMFLDGEIYDVAGLPPDSPPVAGGGGLLARCVELFARDPVAAARRLDGTFNLAFYDPSRRLLHLVSDRLGSRPLYYRDSGGTLCFALEQKAIFAVNGGAPRFDELGVLQLAMFGHQLGDRTIFDGISVLPPATILTASAGGVTLTGYWRAAYRCHHLTGRDAAAELAGRLVAATRRRSVGRRAPLGIFLSGGLDSRCVAGALAGAGAPVTAVTFGDESSRDVRFARQVSSRLGFAHHTYAHHGHSLAAALPRVVWRTEGTLAFPECLSINFHRHIRRDARLIFNGHLGDVLSGGHLLPELFWLRRRDLAGHILRKRSQISGERLRALCVPGSFDAQYHRLTSSIEDGLNRFDEDRTALLYNLWDLDVRQRRYTQSTPAVDRYVLEQVSPFVANDVVEFCLGLPIRELFGQRCYVRAILDAFPACADVPWARTGHAIERSHALRMLRLGGQAALRRGRRMLRIGIGEPVPWLPDDARGGALRAIAQGFVESDRFPDRVFDRSATQAVIDRHFDRGEGHLEEIGVLLTLATASRLLSGDLRAVPAEAQPDLSSTSPDASYWPARSGARFEPSRHASP
jgi:asparagine synthase (glutamine-hydrolysing)